VRVDVKCERFLECCGERDVAVLLAFALLNPDPAAVEVDVTQADADEP
jgi:hypothetical protein